jgi:hypothetical protein
MSSILLAVAGEAQVPAEVLLSSERSGSSAPESLANIEVLHIFPDLLAIFSIASDLLDINVCFSTAARASPQAAAANLHLFNTILFFKP